jgi:molecular chaperone DnaK (HSP70)
MADPETLKMTHERVKKLLTIKPEKGQYTTTTKVRVRDGTTCDVEHKQWNFTVDVGKNEGGNDAGPGPSVVQRGALGSCLAIGYAKWAAYLDVPIDHIEVDVIADVDARGAYGIDEVPPGYKAIRYKVYIESPASDEEIQKMVREAEENAEADKQRKEEVELRNEADQLVFTTEKTLKDLEGKVDASEVAKANEAKDALKAAIEKNELEEIRAKKDALQEIVQALTVKLYEEAAKQAQAGQGPEGGSTAKDDNIVDAEFEEVKDDK